MGLFGVVVDEPLVEILLQRLDNLAEFFAHLEAEELVGHGGIEVFDKTIRAGCLQPGLSVLDAIEFETESVRIGRSARPER